MRFPQILANLLTRPVDRLFIRAANILQQAFDSTKAWLKKAAVPEPEHVLAGCLLLGVGVAACICNYQQMAWALVLLLPVESWARLIAFVLVAMAAATGFMLHTSGSKATKGFAWALFLALMCMEGLIAYQRTVEIGRLEHQDRAAEMAVGPDVGRLTIDGADVSDPQPKPIAAQDKTLDSAPVVSILSAAGLQAALLAVLLAAAVAGCFWRGYARAGGAVARAVALPALAVIGLPLGLLSIINESHWADESNQVLARAFEGMATALARAAAGVARAARGAAGYFSLASRHSRKLRKIRQGIEIDEMQASRRLVAALHIQVDRAGPELLARTHREILEALAGVYRGFPEGVLREVLANVRPGVVTALTSGVSQSITGSVSDVVNRLCVNSPNIRHQAGTGVSKEVIQ
jgi:hypothetical protein